MELNYQGIGTRIKTARIKADLSQEQLAVLVGMSTSHLSNIENGTTRISLTTLVNLANALSVTPDALLCDSVIHAKTQFEQDIQELLAGCDAYEIRVVKEVLSSVIPSLKNGLSLKYLSTYYDQFPNHER